MAIDKGGARLRLLRAFPRGNNWCCTHFRHGKPERFRVACHIGQCPPRRLRQPLQQQQRRGKLVRLAGRHDEVDQSASSIADTDNFGADATPGAAQRLSIAAGVAIESQSQRIGLLGRAPVAFWCARATVPSMQANASFGSPSATTCAMIRSQTPFNVQRRNRR